MKTDSNAQTKVNSGDTLTAIVAKVKNGKVTVLVVDGLRYILDLKNK